MIPVRRIERERERIQGKGGNCWKCDDTRKEAVVSESWLRINKVSRARFPGWMGGSVAARSLAP